MIVHTIDPLTEETLCKPDRPKSVASACFPIQNNDNFSRHYHGLISIESTPLESMLKSLNCNKSLDKLQNEKDAVDSILPRCSMCLEKVELQSKYLDADKLSIKSSNLNVSPSTPYSVRLHSKLPDVATISVPPHGIPSSSPSTMYGIDGLDAKRSSSSLLAAKVVNLF